MSLSRSLQYLFLAIIVTTVGFSLYQWNASRAAVKLQQSTSVNLTNGLVGYWSFDGDDVSGTTAYDRSGSGNNGTLTNGPTKAAGKLGQALNFNGSNQYVAVPNAASLNVATTVTYSAWVKPSSLAATSTVFRKTVSSLEDKYMYITTAGIVQSLLYNTTTALFSIQALSAGNWYLLTETYDGTTQKIYINGILDNSKSASGDVADSTGAFNIGFDSGNNFYFSGLIDDVRIYNRALSAGEIQSLYDLGNPDKVNTPQGDPLEQGLVGYWKLDDGSGTSATDSSGNANTGTLTNGPTWGTGRVKGDTVFDGTDDYISVPQNGKFNVGTTAFTVSMWAKDDTAYATVNTTAHRFISWYDGGARNIQIGLIGASSPSSTRQYYFGNQASNSIPPKQVTSIAGGISTGWHHVVGTFDGATYLLYVDGAVSVGGSTPANLGWFNGNSTTLYIGQRGDNVAAASTLGDLDEVRIYNRALSDEEVAKLYRETVPDNPDTGLVGYWPFNGKDISGTTAYDRSGKGNNGTLTNGPTKTAGRIGQALSFDGVNQYVTTGNTTAFDNLFSSGTSLCAWANFPNFTNYNRLITIENNAGTDYDAWIQTQQSSAIVQFGAGGTGKFKTSTTALSANTWYYLCGVTDYTAGGTKIFINGLEDSGTLGGTPTYTSDKGTFDVGRLRATSSSLYGTGQIDEPRVYNRALSAGEIQSLYALGNPDKVNTAQGDPLEQGLVGYWKLDDGSGTSATDSSGNANTGTLTNGPTWGTGQIGGDVVFDGTNDYIDLGNRGVLNLTNNFTVSLWAYINNLTQSNFKRLFGRAETDTNNRPFYIEYDYSANQYRAVWRNAGTFGVVSGKTLTAVGWQHFVVTFKDGVVKGYSDGVLTGSASGVVQPISTSSNTYIGDIGTGYYFPGSIDEVRVYNRALSDEEVAKLYRETVPDNPDTGLVGYWPFNGKDISGTTAYDRSGKGNNGTLTNGPTRTAGRIGQAFSFDGVNDYVDGGVTVAPSVMSFSLWLNPSAYPSSTFYFEPLRKEGSYHASFNGTSASLQAGIKVSATSYDVNIPNANIPLNTWTLITLTADGSNVRAYVNGTLYGSPTSYSGSISDTAGNHTFIGTYGTTTRTNPGGGYRDFPGKIDEVRIYNRALTATEIQSLYNSGR